jgi:putative transposase
MRKSRYTEAQIVNILKELDAGRPTVELARKHGVHVNTLRLWRSKYGGLETSDLVRLKELEGENSQMERIIARQALEIRAISELIRKNGWGLHSAKKRCGLSKASDSVNDKPAFGPLPAPDSSISRSETRRCSHPRTPA